MHCILVIKHRVGFILVFVIRCMFVLLKPMMQYLNVLSVKSRFILSWGLKKLFKSLPSLTRKLMFSRVNTLTPKFWGEERQGRAYYNSKPFYYIYSVYTRNLLDYSIRISVRSLWSCLCICLFIHIYAYIHVWTYTRSGVTVVESRRYQFAITLAGCYNCLPACVISRFGTRDK